MEFISFAVIVILLIFIGWREHTNDIKQHDMLDRLMAKNLNEYKSETQEEAPKDNEEKDTEIDIENSFDKIEEVISGAR